MQVTVLFPTPPEVPMNYFTSSQLLPILVSLQSFHSSSLYTTFIFLLVLSISLSPGMCHKFQMLKEAFIPTFHLSYAHKLESTLVSWESLLLSTEYSALGVTSFVASHSWANGNQLFLTIICKG